MKWLFFDFTFLEPPGWHPNNSSKYSSQFNGLHASDQNVGQVDTLLVYMQQLTSEGTIRCQRSHSKMGSCMHTCVPREMGTWTERACLNPTFLCFGWNPLGGIVVPGECKFHAVHVCNVGCMLMRYNIHVWTM